MEGDHLNGSVDGDGDAHHLVWGSGGLRSRGTGTGTGRDRDRGRGRGRGRAKGQGLTRPYSLNRYFLTY